MKKDKKIAVVGVFLSVLLMTSVKQRKVAQIGGKERPKNNSVAIYMAYIGSVDMISSSRNAIDYFNIKSYFEII